MLRYAGFALGAGFASVSSTTVLPLQNEAAETTCAELRVFHNDKRPAATGAGVIKSSVESNHERSLASRPKSQAAQRNPQQGASGEYRRPLPTDFVCDQVGTVVLDPDAQVRQTIAYFFENV